MYPDLSYILHDFLGTQQDDGFSVVKTFGLFLALAFFVAAWVLSLELRRKEEAGLIFSTTEAVIENKEATISDYLYSLFSGFFLGFKLIYIIQNFNEFKADAAGIIFSMTGNWVAGMLFALLFAGYRYYESQKNKVLEQKETSVISHSYDKVGDIVMVAAVFGLIGAKLFSVLENFKDFLQDPIGQFFSGSGLTMYGGLILAYFAVYYYVRKRGIPPIQMMDAVAPVLMIGYAVGRLGCHFSGDGDWGIVNTLAKPAWFFLPDSFWAFDYPHNVVNSEGVAIDGCTSIYCRRLVPPVFPTPLYESIACFILTALLWALRKRIKVAGVLFCIYLIFNGLERFFIEMIRVNPLYKILGMQLSQAQGIAIGLILIGFVGGLFLTMSESKKLV